jgi:hypothetical protein
MTIQETVWNYLKSKNLPDKSCAAVMGNIQGESGFNPDIIESGSGIGFGLCQWSYGRRTQLEAYGTDLQHQLDFLWTELTGENSSITGASYQWIDKSDYIIHANFMISNGSIEDLTTSFCFCWERPNPIYAHLDVRQSAANNYYNQFTGTGSGNTNPGTNPDNNTYVQLIYPFWFGSHTKISFSENKFILIGTKGNVVMIKGISNNRHYFVNKSSIKSI